MKPDEAPSYQPHPNEVGQGWKRWVFGPALIFFLGLLVSVGLGFFDRTMEQQVALVREKYPEVPLISGQDLEDWLADPLRPAPVLLDVRTSEEFQVSHIPGARLLPPRQMPRETLATLDPGKPVITYCSVGLRSGLEASLLIQMGFTNVMSLEGSLFQWANDGRALEDGAGSPTHQVHPYNAAYGVLLRPDLRAALSNRPMWLNPEIPLLQKLKTGSALVLLALLLLWETLVPWYGFFRDRGGFRLKHGLRNFAVGVVNTVMVTLLFVKSWWWAANLAEKTGLGLLNAVHLPELPRVLLGVLFLDIWTYFWHRMSHGIPMLWRFHRVHHSEPCMDVTAATRFHLGEIFVSSVLRIPLLFCLGIPFAALFLYEGVLFVMVLFQHANITLPAPVDRCLRWILVTPDMHRVHHSQEVIETDTNFSSLLSIWDRVFGTWMFRKDTRSIQLGLKEFSSEDDQSLKGIFRTPFR